MYDQLARYIQNQIDIGADDLQTILCYFKPLKLAKNELLLRQGEPSQRTFFVGKGCLRVYFNNAEGQEATRYLAFENQFATALVSFISEEPSAEYIQAVEKTEVLCITHKDFYHLMTVVPGWDRFYRNYLEHAYVINTRRLMSFITLDARERYRQLLEQSPKVVQRLPNKLIASYLNISQETLSRLKTKI